jgi:hypothetical protein
MQIKTNTIVIIILALALIASLSFILYKSYETKQQAKYEGYYNAGVQAGVGYAVTEIIKQGSTCQPVPLIYENQTQEYIAVDCLTTANPATQTTKTSK